MSFLKSKWVMFFLIFIAAISVLNSFEKAQYKEIQFSEFITLAKDKQVVDVEYGDSDASKDNVTITAIGAPGSKYADKKITVIGQGKADIYLKVLYDSGIVPNPKNYSRIESLNKIVFGIIGSLIPLALMALVLVWVMKSQIRSGKQMLKTKGPVGEGETSRVKFSDVAGIEESKAELEDYVSFLRNPGKFTSLGGRLPKGALLVGPPGVGKTLLAKAIAGEAGVPFFSISGSQFVEMYVGVGAGRVRDLFEQARRHQPCIIFIDEIDAIGKARNSNPMSSNDEREQTLNQMLVEMDGFEATSGVIVLAATNRPETLDSALLRPGRFDRRIYISLPDIKGREEILKTHARKVVVSPEVNFTTISRGTSGMSGADLEGLVNEAALIAARLERKSVTQADFDAARDKMLMGVERKSLVISEKEKKTTAYHEIGHTLISKLVPDLDPVHKVSIVPRGQALGVTQTISNDNDLSLSKSRAEAMIVMFMGGRAAEELVFNHFTTGASNDLERASGLARRMVCEWGMSDLFGARSFADLNKGGNGFPYSSETLKGIETEISDIVNRAYDKAKSILSTNRTLLDELSLLLLKEENLSSSDLDVIYSKYDLNKQDS